MQILKSLFMAALLGFSALAGAADLQLGRDYDLINPPQPTDSKGKIEVIEFFSYACPHCFHLEPAITPWSQHLPADVAFKRIPLSNGPGWQPTARLFFALDAMGLETKLHSQVFSAIHVDHSLNPSDEASIYDWVKSKGVDLDKFKVAYGFSGPRTEQAKQTMAAYGVASVPTLVVDGRYHVVGQGISAPDEVEVMKQLMALTDQVIDMARVDHAKPHAGKPKTGDAASK